MKILILGLGSIGKRHIEIIKKLNENSEFYALRSSKPSPSLKNITNLYSWKEVESHDFYFSIISSPSEFHFDQIKKVSKLEIPVFVEKPLCVSKKQLDNLNKKNTSPLLYVALNMRFHPLINYLKDYLKNSNHQINEVNAYCGSYLPDWRLDDHKKTYSSSKNLGGGVHLDLIHEPDYLIYLFGYPKKIYKNTRRVSNITNDSCDFANYIFDYNDFSAQITLNYFRIDKKRVMEIVTDKSTIEIDFVKGTIIDLVKKNIILKLDGDLMSESYYEQMKFWIKSIDEKDLSINNLLDSKKLLESIL
jgi:predicted dehydrogenase